ncbi:MAG: ATP synthase F1 subunit gamma [Deltaproteobacteria bacterium]|nr:ATP synthase F1 subunit gamma [Deltaproteobacteria bacterium]
MPSLKAIRNRIVSVKNTEKITRAMKLVAAARLRRAQEAITAQRPYAQRIEEIIAEIATRAGESAHPLLAQREPRETQVLVLSSDRGLAGGFNSNINRRTDRFLADMSEQHNRVAGLQVVGRKGRDYHRRRNREIVREYVGVSSDTALERAKEIAVRVMGDFQSEKLDAVYMIYNEFKNAVSQQVVAVKLLPIDPKTLATGGSNDFIYEPSKEELLTHLLPLHVEMQIYRALLESVASEFGARMTAMENATRNAKEMIDKLQLVYNRSRQAAITKELLEIIGGAEALKG